MRCSVSLRRFYFYPRPPGGGRQVTALVILRRFCISIHALRVEGDRKRPRSNRTPQYNFYPRPPGGGRRFHPFPTGDAGTISIHALRVEGDFGAKVEGSMPTDFYPRPPGGGRQQKRTKFSSVFAQKGEEFASLRRGKREFAGGVLKKQILGFDLVRRKREKRVRFGFALRVIR